MNLINIAEKLARQADALEFAAPVTHVYNPLVYAWQPHRRYLEKYGRGNVEVLLLGMNPGPFGMAQTGVPFGDPALVRDWLQISGRIGRPPVVHPRRPILGFECERGEVSGKRLWGWARETFGSPDRFFRRFFVGNYCPLTFLEQSGRNRTPNKLPVAERRALQKICDAALQQTVAVLAPQWVVAIGAFAEKQARRALFGVSVRGGEVAIGRILHPSPASPKANQGWAGQAERELKKLGIALP
jgi:single-strand selective monofunctional uracil DNA glycosylase